MDLCSDGTVVAGTSSGRSQRGMPTRRLQELWLTPHSSMKVTLRNLTVRFSCLICQNQLPIITSLQDLSFSPAQVNLHFCPQILVLLNKSMIRKHFHIEDDHLFPLAPRRRAEDIMIDRKCTYYFQIFSGVTHGFAVRGNPDVEIEREYPDLVS